MCSSDKLFPTKYPSWFERVSVTLGLCFDFIPVTHIEPSLMFDLKLFGLRQLCPLVTRVGSAASWQLVRGDKDFSQA